MIPASGLVDGKAQQLLMLRSSGNLLMYRPRPFSVC